MATFAAVAPGISCAVEVFIATALLHREIPERKEFTIQEIVNRAAQENFAGELRSGVSVHASQHCCANRAPNPANHRILFATGRSTRRLLLPGDEVHPSRTGKIFQSPTKCLRGIFPCWSGPKLVMSEEFKTIAHSVRDLPQKPAVKPDSPPKHLQALLDLRLAGVHLANGEDPDDYVRRLREGWE